MFFIGTKAYHWWSLQDGLQILAGSRDYPHCDWDNRPILPQNEPSCAIRRLQGSVYAPQARHPASSYSLALSKQIRWSWRQYHCDQRPEIIRIHSTVVAWQERLELSANVRADCGMWTTPTLLLRVEPKLYSSASLHKTLAGKWNSVHEWTEVVWAHFRRKQFSHAEARIDEDAHNRSP